VFEPTKQPTIFPGISRRTFLTLAGLTGLGLAMGCDEDRKAGQRALPDPLDPIARGRGPLMADRDDYAPPTTNPNEGTKPPATTEPANTYGVIPRSSWTRVGPDMKRVDAMGAVKLITFHHSGDPKPFFIDDFAGTAQHLEWVRQYHRSRNFQDIGYHFAIDRAGRVWQLRSLHYEGQHVRSNNPNNIGIVVLGNFDKQQMTNAQREKVKSFGSLVRRMYGLPIGRVLTHQEIVKTECPGDNMQPFMVQIRKQRMI